MLQKNELRVVYNPPQKHTAVGWCVAFCLGEAQTKTLNQIKFWWSENVRDE